MKRYFFTSFLFTVALGSALLGTVALADEYGLDATAGAAGLIKTGSNDLPTLVGNVIGTALSMVGVLFFGLMIYGGILWMTDRGKEEQAKKAFDTIVAATIGIIIVLASYAITKFAFGSIGGSSGGGGGGGGGLPTTQCEQQYGSQGYACMASANCIVSTIKTGFCPGGNDNVCCQAEGGGTETGGGSGGGGNGGGSACTVNSECPDGSVCSASAVGSTNRQCVGVLTAQNWCCIVNGAEGPSLSNTESLACTGYMVALSEEQCRN